MVERRRHERYPVGSRVRLYHPVYGCLDGKIRDVSDGGMFVLLDEVPPLHPGNGDGRFQCEPRNMDVIFEMQCTRVTPEGLVLCFCEEEQSLSASPSLQ